MRTPPACQDRGAISKPTAKHYIFDARDVFGATKRDILRHIQAGNIIYLLKCGVRNHDANRGAAFFPEE
jgi:hypothetical protein